MLGHFEGMYREVMPPGVREDTERMQQLNLLYKFLHILPNVEWAGNIGTIGKTQDRENMYGNLINRRSMHDL